ncbi:MAG: hypothetical protein WBL63_11210, partial [Candidatus Acidiferrum sp.]
MGAGRGASVGSAGGVRAQAPLAEREPVEHVIHGDRRVDHYAWMRNKKDPRVSAYLEAENIYADGEMKATEGFQEKLYQEMLGRILQTDLSVPYRLRGYLYYTRTEEGKQYPIYCRKKESSEESTELVVGSSEFQREENPRAQVQNRPLGHPAVPVQSEEMEEVLLDLNELAIGHTFMGLGIFEVSDDNEWLAYATDTTGFRQFVLEVKDLRDGGLLPFRAERVTSVAWAMDSRTLFYVTEDDVTKRSNQLWRHEFSSQLSVLSSQFRSGEGQEESPQGLKPIDGESLMSELELRP